MPFVPSVVVPPLQPGAAQPGSGYAVPPSQVAGGSLGVHAIIQAGDGILVAVGATTVVSLDEAYTAVLYAPLVHTHPQSDVTSLVTDLAAKAPLASPALTGTPTAPTAVPATNTTQIATTAFVTAAVAASAGGSAATLPFTPAGNIAATNVQAALVELDAEKALLIHTHLWADITDKPLTFAPSAHTHPQSEVTGLVADLALKAALASPALTGVPTAPTAAPATNTTQLATTAFVTAAVAAGGGGGGTAIGTTFTPTGNIAATNVQAALAEVDAEKALLVHTHLWADITDKPLTFAPSAHSHPQSEVTGLVADLALKAPLASPTFTGDPKAPTPLTADNDTSIATTAFVKAQGYLADAPSDGAMYARMDGSWQEAVPNEPGQWSLNGEYNITTYATQKKAQAVNASATTVISRLSGDYVDLTLDINITTLTLSGWPASGTMGQIHLAINFTGAFTITWPAAVKWPGGTAPTLTGVTGKADHIMLVSDDGGTTVWGFVMGQNYDA